MLDSEFNCLLPWELYITAVSSTEEEKGYTFLSVPCLCFTIQRSIIKNKYMEFHRNPFDILTSEKRIDFLNKIVNHDYTYCAKCPVYKAKDYNYAWNTEDFKVLWGGDNGRFIASSLEEGVLKSIMPRKLNIGLDESCNLACKTCRITPKTVKYTVTDEDIYALSFISKRVPVISVGGDGEIFASRNYKKFLANDLSGRTLQEIDMFTNGTLFNEKNWNTINENTRKLVSRVRISIDGASEETYSAIRGNKWNDLMKNLEFINCLKQDIGFDMLTNFTISRYNVNDVTKFADFALSKGFDIIHYSFARPLFHPECGAAEKDFIIPPNERADIIEHLKDLRDQYGKNPNGADKICLLETA